MLDIKELQEASDKTEQIRVDYWAKFNKTVRPEILEKIERACKDSTAIYHRQTYIDIELSKAEEEYLKKQGFGLSRSGYNSHTLISW